MIPIGLEEREKERRMKKSAIYVSYRQSLLWVAFVIACAVGIALVVETVMVDVIHGNPHRTQANAIVMMLVFPPLLGIIAVVGSFLVFTLPQCFQALVTGVLVCRFGRVGQFGTFMLVPLTAVLAWYSYDYLAPMHFNLGINADADWAAYEHGLTPRRYLTMLTIQAPITLFSLLYCDATIRDGSKKSFILAALAVTAGGGMIWGYQMAKAQYQFL
jgi:hypothetical protein